MQAEKLSINSPKNPKVLVKSPKKQGHIWRFEAVFLL